ncbi:pilin [Rhodanobacter sp. DHB23]|uniref:pilin n=1 Tax=Rhodanobacter sp. DHB23 TaxID=2775923 RepID=UPI001783A1FD|nr:pilin [Rhodanobacter sp. DHB23]MBD8871484.1 pilin [Rhodanobacter sp. DHB23]
MDRGDTMPGHANRQGRPSHTEAADRACLPPPPSLHWGWVFLLSVLTLGIFAVVWPFIQANWVRRIDPRSSASLMLWLSLGGILVSFFLIPAWPPGGDATPMTVTERLGRLLQLASGVLFYGAYFAMAASIRRHMAIYRLPLRIGGITLFFFNTLYLQGQLSWLARWQQTGQARPGAAKAVFWVLLGIPCAAILGAVAVPLYQTHVLQAHVARALAQAEPLQQQILDSIDRNRAWPRSNAQAGLKEAGAYASDSLTGFAVLAIDEGTALVTVFGDGAPEPLRGKRLALVAEGRDGAIVWTCGSPDIAPYYLPEQCQ